MNRKEEWFWNIYDMFPQTWQELLANLLGALCAFLILFGLYRLNFPAPAASPAPGTHAWFAEELVKDRAMIPELPSAATVENSRGSSVPLIIAEAPTRAYLAYITYGDRLAARGANEDAEKFFEKIAYWAHLTGAIYLESFHDTEVSCQLFQRAHLFQSKSELYKKEAETACTQYEKGR